MKQYVYYLPELDILTTAESPHRETFVVYIRAIQDYVPFEAVLMGAL